MANYKVDFINQKKIIFVEENVKISEACGQAGFGLNLVCGGKGTCGKCLITIKINGVKEQVLACETIINSNITVYLTEADYDHKANILADSADSTDLQFSPLITKEFKSKKELEPDYCSGFLTGIPLEVMKKFSRFVFTDEYQGATFVKHNKEVIDVQLNDTHEILYGAAIDIGTTSVAMYVYDLTNGELLKTYSNLNLQIEYGADVISRIVYSKESENALKELNERINATINKMLEKADREIPHLKENLYNLMVCGNSTMQHLFFGMSPEGLGVSPFVNITKEMIECFGNETGIKCADKCKIVFLPLLGGFVGADTTSVLVTIPREEKKKLMIDLGTNGEIAVGNIHKYYTSSTACGPAFEGGNIECGMRGAEGAIEYFSIKDDEVSVRVIGNVVPVGICGSAIIDIVAELLKEKIIDESGKVLSKEEFIAIRPESKLCDRLEQIGDYNNAFIIAEGEKRIYISQKDVRQIQLAKGSIYAGYVTLADKYGIRLEEIDELILSGAFGNYIDIENALYIGLLPKIPKEKINSIGNGAGKGVQLCLLNAEHREKCNDIVANTEHYELAANEKFMEEYILNMNFYV